MAFLGRRTPFRPIINNQIKPWSTPPVAGPPVGRLIMKAPVPQNAGRRPSFRSQIINPIAGRYPKIFFIQGTFHAYAASTATRTCDFGADVTAGNSLIVFVSTYSDDATLTVTDSLGQTYTQAGAYQYQLVTGAKISCWYKLGTAGGPCTVSVTASSAVLHTISVAEYSGVGSYHASNNGTSTSTTPSPGSVTADPTDLIVAGYAQAVKTIASDSVASPFTIRTDVLNGSTTTGLATADHTNASGNETPTFTMSESVGWVSVGSSFTAGVPATQPPVAKLLIKGFAARNPGKPVTHNRITNQFATFYVPPVAPVAKVVKKTLISRLYPGKPVTHVRITNPITYQAAQAPVAKLLTVGFVARLYPGKPVTKVRVINQYARLYIPIQGPIGKVVKLSFVALQANRRPVFHTLIIPPGALATPPIPRFRDFPLLNRVPTDNARMARFTEIMGQIINSLARQGLLIKTGVTDYQLSPVQTTDTAAEAGTVFYSTNRTKLCFKSPDGVIHELY